MYENENNEIGILLKNVLKEKTLSIRKFSTITDIDSSTISRIINGKRKATPEHLQIFSEVLNVPTSILFEAAGYSVREEDSELHKAIDNIQDFLKDTEGYNKNFSEEDVKAELFKYEKYAETVEGRKLIDNNFEEKIKNTGSIGPFIDQLKYMFNKFCQNDNSLKQLSLIGGALLYFITSIDIIPDYLFPIGYIDDAFVVEFVSNKLKK